MKNRMKSRRNSGFTVVEMLATVAILVILLAVSAVAAIQYIDKLKIAELDNAAREIFMAAENRAVLLSGAQRLNDLVQEKDPEDQTRITNETTLIGLSELAPHTDEKNYYVYVTANSDLLPYGTIDQTLLDNGEFYIVYDLASGSVTDVFYAEKAEDNETPLETLVNGNSGFETFYSYWAADRSTRLGLKDTSFTTDPAPEGVTPAGAKNSKKTLVGWYNGQAAQNAAAGPDTTYKPYIDVTIINEEELTVRVTVKWDAVIDTKDIKNALMGIDGSLEVTLNGTTIDLAKEYKYILNEGYNEYTVGRVQSVEYKPDGHIFRCTWVLDSLKKDASNNSLQFKEIKGLKNVDDTYKIVPGNEFTVTATISGAFKEASDGDINNSLFASVDPDTKTAEIAYLRHLQNLSADAASGFDSGVGDNVTDAVQIATIWGDGNGGYTEKTETVDGVTTTTYVRKGFFETKQTETVGETPYSYYYKFIPITNSNLTGTFTAASSRMTGSEGTPIETVNIIEGLYVHQTRNAGLFGTNYGTVDGVNLVKAVIIGSENVGGYVGINQGTVKNCNNTATLNQIEIVAVAAGTANPKNIGGIVGLHQPADGTKPTGIENCVNQMPVSSSAASYVGGIVGNFDGSKATGTSKATMQNCYNGIADTAGTGGAVVISGASNVGGLAGSSAGGANALILDSKNYAYVNGTGDYVGGLVGDNGCYLGTNGIATETHTCANYGNVTGGTYGTDGKSWSSGGTNVGGIAGRSSGTVDGDQTLIGGIEVKGYKNVGGFVGVNNGVVQNCERPESGDTIIFPINSGSNIGGIVGQSGTDGVLINCENHAAINFPNCDGVGGIVGENYGLVGTKSSTAAGTADTVCYNTGDITGKDSVGGLVGVNRDGVVDGCNSTANSGTISGANQVGGFVGGMNGGTVRNCSKGHTLKDDDTDDMVTGKQNVGGIVGQVTGGTVQGCVNEGPVSASETESNVGGIVGKLSGTVTDCRNTMRSGVNFTGKNYIGGIAGYVDSGSTVDNCYNGDRTLSNNASNAEKNFGTIEGANYVGGIAGYIVSATISNSYNKANVDAGYYVGGLVGASNGGTIQNNYNNGRVNGTDYVGGLLGLSTGDNATIINTNYVDGSSALPHYDGETEGEEKVYQLLVTAANGHTHYGTIVGSCEVKLIGMDRDDDVLPELKRGRIAGTDAGAPTVGTKVLNTDNIYYYTETGTLCTVTANHTDANVKVAAVELTRTFYRNNIGGASSGSGARLPRVLFDNNAVQSMNYNGGTTLWAWTGGREDGRPVLLGIGEGEYVTWNYTGKPVVDVMDADVKTYTVKATLADWVPTGGEWNLPSDTNTNNIIANWNLSSVNGQECTFTVTVDTEKTPSLPMNYNAILEYTRGGETYYGVITVNYNNFAGLAFYGGGSAPNPENLYYEDLGNNNTGNKLHVYFRLLTTLGGNPYSDYKTWSASSPPECEITSFKITKNGTVYTSTLPEKVTGQANPYVIIPVPDGFTLNDRETATMVVSYTVAYDTRNTTFIMDKTETITLHGGSYTAGAALSDDQPSIDEPPELDGPGLDDAPVAALPPDPEDWGTLDPEDPEPEGNKSAEPEAGEAPAESESPAEDETDPEPEESEPKEPPEMEQESAPAEAEPEGSKEQELDPDVQEMEPADVPSEPESKHKDGDDTDPDPDPDGTGPDPELEAESNAGETPET